jgi:hypothetical protein
VVIHRKLNTKKVSCTSADENIQNLKGGVENLKGGKHPKLELHGDFIWKTVIIGVLFFNNNHNVCIGQGHDSIISNPYFIC